MVQSVGIGIGMSAFPPLLGVNRTYLGPATTSKPDPKLVRDVLELGRRKATGVVTTFAWSQDFAEVPGTLCYCGQGAAETESVR
jgi:hypothetical protein